VNVWSKNTLPDVDAYYWMVPSLIVQEIVYAAYLYHMQINGNTIPLAPFEKL